MHKQVKAGDTVTFDAGDNMILTQSGTSFTYGLTSDVNTNSIRLGGSKDTNGSWTGGIYIGKQSGGGANPNEGNYITGLDNTLWDLSKVVDNRAATEGQLKAVYNQATTTASANEQHIKMALMISRLRPIPMVKSRTRLP